MAWDFRTADVTGRERPAWSSPVNRALEFGHFEPASPWEPAIFRCPSRAPVGPFSLPSWSLDCPSLCCFVRIRGLPRQPDPDPYLVRHHRPHQLRSRLPPPSHPKLPHPKPLLQPSVRKLRQLRSPPIRLLRPLRLHPRPMPRHQRVFCRPAHRPAPLVTPRTTLPSQFTHFAIHTSSLVLPVCPPTLVRNSPVFQRLVCRTSKRARLFVVNEKRGLEPRLYPRRPRRRLGTLTRPRRPATCRACPLRLPAVDPALAPAPPASLTPLGAVCCSLRRRSAQTIPAPPRGLARDVFRSCRAASASSSHPASAPACRRSPPARGRSIRPR